jgi:hypothetical protein
MTSSPNSDVRPKGMTAQLSGMARVHLGPATARTSSAVVLNY